MPTILACLLLFLAVVFFALIVDWFMAYLRDSAIVRKLKKKGALPEKFTFKDYRELKNYIFHKAVISYAEEKRAHNNVKERISEREETTQE